MDHPVFSMSIWTSRHRLLVHITAIAHPSVGDCNWDLIRRGHKSLEKEAFSSISFRKSTTEIHVLSITFLIITHHKTFSQISSSSIYIFTVVKCLHYKTYPLMLHYFLHSKNFTSKALPSFYETINILVSPSSSPSFFGYSFSHKDQINASVWRHNIASTWKRNFKASFVHHY